MGLRQIITLNGVKYDAHTGERLDVSAPSILSPKTTLATEEEKGLKKPTHKKAAPVTTVHRRQQKSSALRRNYLKKPVSNKPVEAERKRPNSRVVRSDQIVRFAPHPKVIKQVNDITQATPIAPSPLMQAALQKAKLKQASAKTQKTPKLSSTEIKNGLIQAAMQKTVSKTDTPHRSVFQKIASKKSHKTTDKFWKLPQIATACMALALFGGYLTYINMPGISIQIASAQSGVEATFPNYNPDGYKFAGPVQYSFGEVKLNFVANGGTHSYTIDQKSSGWNSVAVLDNFVTNDSNGRYEIEAKNGITLYSYDNKVVWSNGGVLYTLKSDAPLSKAQLLDIATSM